MNTHKLIHNIKKAIKESIFDDDIFIDNEPIESKVKCFGILPRTKQELKAIIKKRIRKNGPNCDLCDIDISLINDLSYVFKDVDFNGDISLWDTSHVIKMRHMFENSTFNGDLSSWDVSNVIDMTCMFADSSFNNDSIQYWKVSKVRDMSFMFYNTYFNQDISAWDVSKVKNMDSMFMYSNFNKDISDWNVSNVILFDSMFKEDSAFRLNLSRWNIKAKSGKFFERLFSCMFYGTRMTPELIPNIIIYNNMMKTCFNEY